MRRRRWAPVVGAKRPPARPAQRLGGQPDACSMARARLRIRVGVVESKPSRPAQAGADSVGAKKPPLAERIRPRVVFVTLQAGETRGPVRPERERERHLIERLAGSVIFGPAPISPSPRPAVFQPLPGRRPFVGSARHRPATCPSVPTIERIPSWATWRRAPRPAGSESTQDAKRALIARPGRPG